jgi:N-acetylglucosamine kinase-like BadF-type ATPase
VGGTGARWALVDDAGTLLAQGTAPGATGHLFAEVERARFTAMVAAAAAALPARPDAIHIGSTGLGPTAHDDARAILSAALKTPPARITLSDDMELGHRLGWPPHHGRRRADPRRRAWHPHR